MFGNNNLCHTEDMNVCLPMSVQIAKCGTYKKGNTGK